MDTRKRLNIMLYYIACLVPNRNNGVVFIFEVAVCDVLGRNRTFKHYVNEQQVRSVKMGLRCFLYSLLQTASHS
jgi:hypothetical protein